MLEVPNRRVQYNVEAGWKTFGPHTDTLVGLDPGIETLRFRRDKNSHRGISNFKSLRRLFAFCVNQECLEEISELPLLEMLYISETTATNPVCLGRCRALRYLIVKGGTKVPNLSWFSELPPLESLLLEHFKLVRDLTALQSLPSLKAFGFEGSMWSTQHVQSFRPITFLPRVEALFLTRCRPDSEGLQPLEEISGLKHLQIAACYPDDSFRALRRALPELECQWFHLIDEYGGTRAAIKGMMAKAKATRRTSVSN